MTQRFGRNQRRRAREAIAALETRNQILFDAALTQRTMLESAKWKVGQLQAEIDEAKEIAGRMSVLFPAETVKMDITPQKTIRDYVDTPMSSLSEYLSMDDDQAQCIQTQDLPVLLAKIDRNAMDRSVHMLVEFRGKVSGYAISEHGLQSRTGNTMLAELARTLPRLVNVQLFGARR